MIASSDMLQMATALFAAITVGLVLYGILNKEFRAQARMRQRILKLASEGTANAAPERSAGARTQRSINAALRDIEQMKRAHYRAPILVRLRRAGLQISPLSYHLIRLGMATLGGLVTHLAGGSGMIVLLVASALGLILPALVLRLRLAKRTREITEELPNAIDVIVRGVRSGLPLPDCLRMLSTEATEPLRSEFRKLMTDISVGLTMEQAVQRLADRVPVAEARFFAIVVSIQSKTGGNLSESLANLSALLRDRKKMRGKVQSMSSEAKTSAWIIGALPVLVSGVVSLTSPDYMAVLFNSLIGNAILLACALWMLMGVLVMRNMINFEV
jgi:tight adherence protein B